MNKFINKEDSLEKIQEILEESFVSRFGVTSMEKRADDAIKNLQKTKMYGTVKEKNLFFSHAVSSVMQGLNEFDMTLMDAINKSLQYIYNHDHIYKNGGRKKHIGLYGGSFNMPHLGHNDVCFYSLYEMGMFDEIRMCFAYENLTGKKYESIEHRKAIGEINTQNNSNIKMFTYESDKKLNGETHHFLNKLLSDADYNYNDFSWIIGGDTAEHLPKWKESDKLIKQVPFVVYPRQGYELNELYNRAAKGANTLHFTPEGALRDASSSAIKKALSGNDTDYLKKTMHPEAVEYIRDNKLYGVK